jgi:hypothetical protein
MVQQQLAAIIQQIQMEGRTGFLSVKRGEGRNLEEGTVLFINGKMEEARVGRRTKFDAFKYLCTWEHYEFLFRAPDGQGQLFSFPFSSFLAYRSPGNPLPPSTPVPSHLQANPSNLQKRITDSAVLIPYHSRHRLFDGLQVIEKMGLMRGHRRLFLLINGERSVAELARLTASSEDEVYQRLQDLEKAAVIHIAEKY